MRGTAAERVGETSGGSRPSKMEPGVARSAGAKVEQQYFDFEQAGQYIGKSKQAIRGYVFRGMLRAKKVGAKLRFISRADLDKFAS